MQRPDHAPRPDLRVLLLRLLIAIVTLIGAFAPTIIAVVLSIFLLDLFSYGLSTFEPGYGRLAFVAAIYFLLLVVWEEFKPRLTSRSRQ